MRIVSEGQARAGARRASGGTAAGGGKRQPRHPAGAARLPGERAAERYRLFMLGAQGPLPDRDGVILETPFVGPGMREAGARLDYLPMRLSLVPRLFATMRPPDVVLLHTSTSRRAKVSLGIEVNILLAAIEAVRARGGLVVAQLNPRMPYTLGDGELSEELIDLAIEVDEPLASPARSRSHSTPIASLSRGRASSMTARRCSWASARSRTQRFSRYRAGASRDLVGDDQRRRDGARARWRPGRAAPDRVLVPVRIAPANTWVNRTRGCG